MTAWPKVYLTLHIWMIGLLLFFTTGLHAYKLPLNKENAIQSSTWAGYGARLATDGNKNPIFAGRSCTHSLEEAKPWWMVKLDKLYTVTGVNIFNRKNAYRRLKNLNITVGNDTNLSKQSLCAYFDGIVSSGGNTTVWCDEELSGRYLSVQKTTRGAFDDLGRIWYNRSGYLTLCEVEIYGYERCAEGYFGKGCRTACNCMGKCSSESGKCDGECYPGRRGSSCQAECADGYFGRGCKFPCHCKGKCSADNGTCDGTCLPGWRGRACQEVCAEGYFGLGCETPCYCLSNCSAESGTCEGTCSPGRKGKACQEGSSVHPSVPSPIYVTSSSVLLRWHMIGEYDNSVKNITVSYTIQFSTDSDGKIWEDGPSKMDVLDSNDTELRVTGLKYNSYYRFRVLLNFYLQRKAFPGPSSQPSLPVKTRCEAPLSPAIVTAKGTRDTYGRTTSIYVEWKKLQTNGHHCSRYDRLEVLYYSGTHPPWTQQVTSHHNRITFSVIFPQRGEYSVALQVVNDEEIASTSKTLSIKQGAVVLPTSATSTRPKPDMGAPSVFFVSSDSVHLKLQLPKAATSYMVQYRKAAPATAGLQWSDGPVFTRKSNAAAENMKVEGLVYNTAYVFRVVPYDQTGKRATPSSETLPIKTTCTAPEPPAIESGRAIEDTRGRVTAIHIRWKKLPMDGHNCNRYTKIVVICYNAIMHVTKIVVTSSRQTLTFPVTFPLKSEYFVAVRVYNDESIFSTSATWRSLDMKGIVRASQNFSSSPLEGAVTETLVSVQNHKTTINDADGTHSHSLPAAHSGTMQGGVDYIVLSCLTAVACVSLLAVVMYVVVKYLGRRYNGRWRQYMGKREEPDDIQLNGTDVTVLSSSDSNNGASLASNSKTRLSIAAGTDENLYVDVA